MTPRTRTGLVVAIAAGTAVAAALLVVALVVDGPTALDVRVSSWVAVHRTDPLIDAMEVVTVAGSFNAVVAVGAVGVVWAVARKDWRPFLLVIPAAALASLTTNLLKLVVARPRPGADIALREFSGYSFPSGHATTAAALWGGVAAVFVAMGWWRARTGVAFAACMALLVGASRIVLGAHWLTDVTAGFGVGTAVLAAALLLRTPARAVRGPLVQRWR